VEGLFIAKTHWDPQDFKKYTYHATGYSIENKIDSPKIAFVIAKFDV
jgi:hypothetical protein